MKNRTAFELVKAMQEYLLAYTEHAYGDYDYSKLLSKDEVSEVCNYLQSALRKANALYEALDNLENIEAE